MASNDLDCTFSIVSKQNAITKATTQCYSAVNITFFYNKVHGTVLLEKLVATQSVKTVPAF
jgi:hypothetical protein